MSAWTAELRTLACGPQRKDQLKVLAELQADGGWVGRIGGRGHVRVKHLASGRSVTIPSTPSDYRCWRNTRADLRRVREGRCA